jgi:hypothetical protein
LKRIPVSVRVTSKVVGSTLIVPFNFKDGLQTYPKGHPKAGGNPLYRVNKYAMLVNGQTQYEVIRFGLQNHGTVPKMRICDAGLRSGRTVRPSWVPGYKPHSFEATGYEGAWRIIDGKGFLIHEGPDVGQNQVGGSLGCIEVLDGRWPDFMDELINITEQQWPEIGKHRLMTLTIDATHSPTAVLVY